MGKFEFEFEIADRYYEDCPPRKDKVIGTCPFCGDSIYDYEDIFTLNGETYHFSCAEDNFTVKELMKKVNESVNYNF